jgi:glycosyltransferase involved in cell wall biosynthesis
MGIPLRVLPGGPMTKLIRAYRLRRLLREDDARIAHAFLIGPSKHTALATLGRGDISFIASIRSGVWERPMAKRVLESWALKRAKMVTVNSTSAIDFVAEYYGVSVDKLRYIPNGVDALAARLPDKPAAREALGLSAEGPVVLGLFRLSPEKELDLFCGVVESVLEGFPGGVCLIAGDGPQREWLDDRVARSPCPDAFRLLGARDDIPTLLAASDVMLMTSRSEGMPNSILEAMSAGLPVVATGVGGIRDLVEEGATGHLCDVGDKTGLVGACRRLLLDSGVRAGMGLRARERAETEFSVERMVEAYQALYETLSDKASKT